MRHPRFLFCAGAPKTGQPIRPDGAPLSLPGLVDTYVKGSRVRTASAWTARSRHREGVFAGGCAGIAGTASPTAAPGAATVAAATAG